MPNPSRVLPPEGVPPEADRPAAVVRASPGSGRLTPVTEHPIPAPFLAGDLAAPPRTLVDVIGRSVREAPDALAIDSGVQTLTYAELDTAARQVADRLAEHGIGRGARVGIRIRSGTTDLYVAIIGTLYAGAAYVPVDADDPDERARVVFSESQVAAVIGNDLAISPRGACRGRS